MAWFSSAASALSRLLTLSIHVDRPSTGPPSGAPAGAPFSLARAPPSRGSAAGLHLVELRLDLVVLGALGVHLAEQLLEGGGRGLAVAGIGGAEPGEPQRLAVLGLQLQQLAIDRHRLGGRAAARLHVRLDDGARGLEQGAGVVRPELGE